MRVKTTVLTLVEPLSSKALFAWVLCISLIAFQDKTVWAEVDAATLSLSSSKIFERMLAAAGEGDVERVLKALSLLKPLEQDVSKSNSLDIQSKLEQAAKSGNNDLLVNEVRRFIALSVKLRMDANVEQVMDRKQVASNIKEAYKDYLVLDPFIRKNDFDLSKKFKLSFRKANATASSPEKLRVPCEEICLLLDQKVLKNLASS